MFGIGPVVRPGTPAPAGPVEKEPIYSYRAGGEAGFDRLDQSQVVLVAARFYPEPREHRIGISDFIDTRKGVEDRRERLDIRDLRQRDCELDHIPMDRLRLTAEGV